MTLDLRGDWIQDSKIRARCSMGDCRIRVPEEVALDLSRPRVFLGEGFISRRVRERADPPAGAPSLSVVSSQTMGSIRIE